MLKMTRRLFAIHPDIKYAEYEERALFNHVLASIDPADGRTCYMVPVGRGVRHEYQDMSRSFTCCVGSGMENHGLHGDGIYYESEDRLWVNLYVPSIADWQTAGATVTMDTTFPEGNAATLKLALKKPKSFTLSLRRPSWAGDGFVVMVDGKAVSNLPAPGSYVELKRTWKTGDIVSLLLPKTLHIEGTPDNENRAALMWGPLVLAGDLGEERSDGPAESIPSFVTEERPIGEWLKPVTGMAGEFHAVGRSVDDRPAEVEFVPFYRLHRRTYAVYWDLYTNKTWTMYLAKLAGEKARQRELEAATIAFVQPGDNTPGEEITRDRGFGRLGVRSKKWFSFDLPVDAANPMALVVTYYTEERARRSFVVLVDDERVGAGTISRSPPGSATGNFYEINYKIPAELLKDKKKVTVRFQAANGDETATVFGVRIIKAALDAGSTTPR
jgi:hypothetical protein